MPKNKRPNLPASRPPARPALNLNAALDEIEALSARGQLAEVDEVLQALEQRYPHREEVMAARLNYYFDTQDMRRYQPLAERLYRIRPDDPDLTVSLAGAYLSNFRLGLALRTFRRFLQRWPDHHRAADARRTVDELTPQLQEELERLGFGGDAGLEAAVMHEEVQTLLEAGDFRGVYRTAQRLLQKYPDMIPVLNNLSLAYAQEGRLDQAIATAHRVLAIDPANFHALGNLIRYLCMAGRIEETTPWAEQLKAVIAESPDVWVKKAEGLSYLGDDQGVLDAYRGAERLGLLKPPLGNPLLCHLAAVAALRQDREADARRYWQQALQLAPGFEFAATNLADLRQPVGARHAPWPFTLQYWLTPPAFAGLRQMAEKITRRTNDDDDVINRLTLRFLQQHPEVVDLVPILLDRGDPHGREFAVNIATWAGTPELLDALHDFVFSDRGPDTLRNQAARTVSQAGLLPAGPVTMWLGGEWRDVLLMGFEIHSDPTTEHGPEVTEIGGAAVAALHAGDYPTAVRLLQQALAIEPDAPDLLNNLALAYEQQGRPAEADALVDQIREEHPDYAFAQIAHVKRLIQRRELPEARAILDALMTRPRFHINEYSAFCDAQISYFLAEDGPHALDAARSWLDMWASVEPDAPEIGQWELMLKMRELPGRLGARRRGGRKRTL